MAAYSEAVQDIRDRLDKLTRSIERFKAKLSPMERERAKLQTALEVLMGMADAASLSGDSDSRAPQNKSTTKDAIARLLEEAAPEPMTIGEIAQRLEDLGRDVPTKTIRGTLSHGKREGIFHSPSRGKWQAITRLRYATEECDDPEEPAEMDGPEEPLERDRLNGASVYAHSGGAP
jgi:restriction endonuclease Mrr